MPTVCARADAESRARASVRACYLARALRHARGPCRRHLRRRLLPRAAAHLCEGADSGVVGAWARLRRAAAVDDAEGLLLGHARRLAARTHARARHTHTHTY
eukprot:2713602-Pleurochrysis_carterae.AAC.2